MSVSSAPGQGAPPAPAPLLAGSVGRDVGGGGWRDDAAEAGIGSSYSGFLELAGTWLKQMCMRVCGRQIYKLVGDGTVMRRQGADLSDMGPPSGPGPGRRLGVQAWWGGSACLGDRAGAVHAAHALGSGSFCRARPASASTRQPRGGALSFGVSCSGHSGCWLTGLLACGCPAAVVRASPMPPRGSQGPRVMGPLQSVCAHM